MNINLRHVQINFCQVPEGIACYNCSCPVLLSPCPWLRTTFQPSLRPSVYPGDATAVPPTCATSGSSALGRFDAVKRRAHNIIGNTPDHAPQHRDCRRHSTREQEGSIDTSFTFQSRDAPLDLSVHKRSCSDLWHTHLAAISISGIQISGM